MERWLKKFLIPNIALLQDRRGREKGGAQCDIKYLIPNTTLTNCMRVKRVNEVRGGECTM